MSTNVTSVGVNDNMQMFVVEAVIDPPSMATTVDGLVAGVTLDGVSLGDAIIALPPYDMVNIIYQASPIGEGQADVNFYNAGTGTTNLAAAVWRFLVIKA